MQAAHWFEVNTVGGEWYYLSPSEWARLDELLLHANVAMFRGREITGAVCVIMVSQVTGVRQNSLELQAQLDELVGDADEEEEDEDEPWKRG